MVGSTELGEEKLFSFVAAIPVSQLKRSDVRSLLGGVIGKLCCCVGLRVAASLPGVGELDWNQGWVLRTFE